MEPFQTLNDEGVTVVMITHDLDVANHAKRVLHIRDGQFAEQHIPEEKEAEAVNLPQQNFPLKKVMITVVSVVIVIALIITA